MFWVLREFSFKKRKNLVSMEFCYFFNIYTAKEESLIMYFKSQLFLDFSVISRSPPPGGKQCQSEHC